MKYSENPNYLDYMRRYAAEDYASARAALMRCLEDLRKDSPESRSVQESDLLRRIGDLFFLEGDVSAATKQYQLSEQTEPRSLLAKYYFAKFLGEKLGDIKGAVAKCDEIVHAARQHPKGESEADFSSDKYVAMAGELKRALLAPSP